MRSIQLHPLSLSAGIAFAGAIGFLMSMQQVSPKQAQMLSLEEKAILSHMSLVNTTFMTLDNQRLIVPNNMIWQTVITNVTAQRVRRVDLVFGVSYSDDLDKVEKILTEIVESYDAVLDSPEPNIRLHELADSSVNFIVRPWVKTDDYWDTYWDLTKIVKQRFDAEGISIPFPQRDVHVIEPATP